MHLQNIAYGTHPRQVLDLWLAEGEGPRPLYLFFHGGGFVNGDKGDLPAIIIEALLAGGVSVASANYRFTGDPEYLASLLDGGHALQFIRAHAGEWNIDPEHIASGGCSAGSCTTYWLAFGPDRAQPESADPVARQSTRLQATASWEIQSTLDAHWIREHIAGPTWTIESISQLIRMPVEQYDTAEARRRFREVDFLSWIGPDAPPSFAFNVTPQLPMTDDLEIGPGIHHPIFALALREKLAPLGIECVVRLREDLPALEPEQVAEQFFRESAEFVIRTLVPEGVAR